MSQIMSIFIILSILSTQFNLNVHKDNFNPCSGILNFQGLEYTTKLRKRIGGIYCEKYVNDYNNNNQFGAVRSNSKVKFSFSKVLLFRLLIVRRR